VMRDYRSARLCLPIEDRHGEEGLFISIALISWEWNKLTATNVPGRKTIVRTARAFIAELSLWLAAEISRESAARLWLDFASR
jgi:hypothetical protein